MDRIAILGCGLIGESWAALFLAHGHDVAAWDPNAAALDGFEGRVRHCLGQVAQAQAGLPPPGRLTVASSLAEAVAVAGWIQENAPEKAALKRELYARLEDLVGAEVIIASSTSSLTWSELATDLRHPARFITAHPFNPPHLMPLVEIHARDEGVHARAAALYEGLGRKTVRVRKDASGHIANRLASALWREAVHIVAEGIADVEDVDAAMVHGPGLRWAVIGPHMAYHLGGGAGGIRHYLEHLGPSQERRWSTLGSPSLTAETCATLVAGIEREAAGRSIAQLSEERDAALIAILGTRQETRG